MIEVALEKRIGAFDLDLAFRHDGRVTALFGRSGAGKSMSLSMIAGLARPDRGVVRIDDVTLVDLPKVFVPAHRRRIGVVFQEARLFPHLTVRQNLVFGRWFAPPGAARGDFAAIVETLGISGLLDRRPAGLSGGERQRVAIGRALLSGPRLLLFDEPLAALDRPRKLEILPLIERLRDTFAIPIVYVSHAIEEVVRLADHVVILEAGKVTAQGAPGAVLGASRRPDEPRFGRATVLDVTVGATDPVYGLTALHHPAGTVWLVGKAGGEGQPARALIAATDVTLSTGPAKGLSTRSALSGTVARIEADGALAAVEIALAGGAPLLALVTRRAVDDLGLAEGRPVEALIKTVALDEGAVPGG